MAKMRLELGAELDTLTKGELDHSLGAAVAMVREEQRGLKYRRIPQLSGVAAGGVLNIGGDVGGGPGGTWSGASVGPHEGWAWELGLITVSGLTFGSVPDIVNMYIVGAGSAISWWQFNGNNFAYTFSGGSLVLLPGERLQLISVGTFAATGTITLTGSIRSQMPAEKLGRVTAQ
jgi:hypothetical protein